MTPTLTEWANFYVIVGSSAGALVGLQFVVITLIGDARQADAQASGAFATPSVVHFGAALLLSAIVSAPWGELTPVAVLWGLMGLFGFIYSVVVILRLRAQTAYKPVFEDWLFYGLLPVVSYAVLAASACAIHSRPQMALYLVAAAALLLLFIGIHNAWDVATYHIFVKKQEQPENEQDSKAKES
jgi:hypothetical protein